MFFFLGGGKETNALMYEPCCLFEGNYVCFGTIKTKKLSLFSQVCTVRQTIVPQSSVSLKFNIEEEEEEEEGGGCKGEEEEEDDGVVMIRRKTPRPRPRTELTWCVRAVSGGDVVRTFVLWRP